jgi:hypothetical protein
VNLARPALLVLASAAFSTAQAQTLFKCVGRDGKVSYQSEKCADAVRESTVRPPDPVAPRADPPADAATPPKAGPAPGEPAITFDAFIAYVSYYENCASLVPGFGAKHAANYKLWRERHRTTSARFNQDGEAQRRVRDSNEQMRRGMSGRSAEQREYDADNCEKTVAPIFAPPNPSPNTPTKN